MQPQFIHFGTGAAHDYHYPSNSLIITSKGAISRGWIDYLKIKNFSIFDEIEPNPSIEIVENIISQFKNENFSSIIGLGGGSSNAATTLIALAKIWNIKTTSKSLLELGLELGSDVPFFLNGMNAWIEGRGEVITNIYLRPKWYLLIFSPYFISTKEIYELVNTENDEKKYDFDDFINDRIQNDFEKIVLKKHPSIAKTKKWLARWEYSQDFGTPFFTL